MKYMDEVSKIGLDDLEYRLHRMKVVDDINNVYRETMNRAERRDEYFINKLNISFDIEKNKLEEINKFWEKYEFAYKNNPKTQIAFYKISGVFDPSYIGFGLQRFSLVRFWNNETFSTFRNKSFSKLLFPFVKSPKNYIENVYGTFINIDRTILSENETLDEIIRLLSEFDSLIIKPTLDSGSGNSIGFINKSDSKHEILNKIKKYKQNFAIQQRIKNHSSYALPNASSLNTLRIVTLLWNNEIRFVGAAFRMGINSQIDNWDAGGIVCGVDRNGVCGKFAVNGRGDVFCKHPNGFEFAGYKLYKAESAINLAIECHKRIVQQKYISWDFTVDEYGDIQFIEMNSPGGTEVLQVLGINAYIDKKLVQDLLDDYLIHRFFFIKANFDWDYREFSDHISLLKYWGVEHTVVVPNKIDGKEVRIVYENAFNNCQIDKVIINKTTYFKGVNLDSRVQLVVK